MSRVITRRCRRTYCGHAPGVVLVLLAAVAAAWPACVRADEPAPFAVNLGADEIVVSGATPRGVVSLLVVARDESQRWPEVIRQHEQLADEDGDGTVRLRISVPPHRSVVVAIDHGDGRFTTWPALASIRPVPVPADGLTSDPEGRPLRLAAVFSHGFALLVRPSKGAWSLPLSEGGAEDDDRQVNQRATVAFARMRAKDGSRGPDHLLPRDVLVLADTSTLRLLVIRREAGQ